MNFASNTKPERGNEYLVDLEAIVVDHSVNNRFTKSDVKILIQSISQYGQLEAVGAVRVKPGNVLHLAYGFGRYEAIKKINERLPADQQMKIKVAVFDGNERDVFFRNLAENAHRKNLSHIDYAMAIRNMSEKFGQTDSQIANFFGYTGGWVSQHRSLLSLDYRVQEKVHSEEMNVTDALALLKLPEEKKKEVVEEILKVTVSGSSSAQAGEQQPNEEEPQGSGSEVPSTKPEEEEAPIASKPVTESTKKRIKEAIRKAANAKKKRSWAELHDFFEVMIGSPAVSDELQQFANVMMLIMTGELENDSDAVEALEALMGGK